MHVLALLAFAFAPAIDVQGADCPGADAVAAHLRSLGAEAPTARAGRVQLRNATGLVDVRLVDADGKTVAQQRLVDGGSCEELAEAVAVLVAAWTAELAPGVVPPTEAAPRARPAVKAAPAAPVDARWSSDVGAGVVAVLGAAPVAPGGVVEAFLGPAGVPAVLRLAAAVSTRERPLADARFRVSELLLSAAPGYRLTWMRRWLVDVYAGVGANLTSASGQGYGQDRHTTGISPAAVGGLRLAVRFGWWAPWIGGSGAAGLLRRTATVAGTALRQELPRAGLFVGAGVAIGTWR